MKLVLVSQDKKRQIIYNGLEYYNAYGKSDWYGINNRSESEYGDVLLAHYSTEEKVKKVMNDILNILKKERFKIITNDRKLSQEKLLEINKRIYNHENILLPNGVSLEKIEQDYIVYEFPQDEEVDVE